MLKHFMNTPIFGSKPVPDFWRRVISADREKIAENMMSELPVTKFEAGDVLIDADLLETGILATREIGDRPWLKRTVGLSSLAQFIQSLVLHNHIYFDSHVCNHSTILPPTDELKDIVCPFVIDPAEDGILRERAYGLPATDHLDVLDEKQVFSTEAVGDYWLAMMDSSQISTFLFEWKFVLSYRLSRISLPSSPYSGLLYGAMARAYYYLAVSFATGIPYEPYTLYAPFVEQLLPQPTPYNSFAKKAIDRVTNAAKDEAQQLNEYLPTTYFTVGTPAIFSYVAKKASSRKDLIPITLDVRMSKEAIAFRKICSEFDEATRAGNDGKIIRIIKEMEYHLNKLGTKLDEPNVSLQIGIPLSVSFEPLKAWEHIKSQRQRHLVFLDQLYKEVIQSPNLLARLGFLVSEDVGFTSTN